MAWARSRCTLEDQNCDVNWVFEVDSGFVFWASRNVFRRDGSSRIKDSCKPKSSFKRLSSSHTFPDFGPEIAFAMVIAADEPPPCAAATIDSALTFWMAVARASLTAFASALASFEDTKVKR